MNHNYTPIPPPTFCVPANADQIRVSARYLYFYMRDAPPYFENWLDSLRQMADDPDNSMMGFRVFYDGNYNGINSTLNLNLTIYLIGRSSHCATGAVARVILAEGLLGAANGHLDHINLTLDNYQGIGRFSGYVCAWILHAFLRVQMPFDYWLQCKKKELGIRCGRDYYRVFGKKKYWNENGHGTLYFDEFTAERVIMATQTHRAQWASFYLTNPSS